MLLMCRGPWWPGLVSGSESPHQEDRRDAGQRCDADGARRRAVVARILGHRVNLERALVVLVADERRDYDLPRLALGSIVLGNVNCRGRRASRLLIDHWRFDPRAGDLNSSSARKESPQLAYMFRGARSFNQPLNNWDVRTRMCDYVPIRSSPNCYYLAALTTRAARRSVP